MRKHRWVVYVTVTLVLLLSSGTAGSTYAQDAVPQATVEAAFTYQGRLTNDQGEPLTGTYDFEFRLYDGSGSGAAQVGSAVTVNDQQVNEGYFTVQLDFGASAFTGDARWLEVAVRAGSSTGSYTALSPRQALTAAPYALSLRPGARVEGSPGLLGALFSAETPDGNVGGTFAQNLLLGAAGVYGHTDISGMGVYGQASNSNYTAYGVYGLHDGSGDGYGGYFKANDEDNAALYSEAPETAIIGHAYTDTITSTAVLGKNPESGTQRGAGVRGLAGGADFADIHPYICVLGSCFHMYYSAAGEFAGPNGVIGAASSNDGYGVVGMASSSSGKAGYFVGDVTVTGDLEVSGSVSKGGGGFKIDHPLDPESKYLSHSFVESPERINVYNGNVTTDDEGYATVQLPDYFEALNKDYTYQLTVIGTFAQAIVAEEIQNNQFVIQTDQPNVKVSWQVTGVRQDLWAEAHPFEDEEEKPPEEQGTYLHPDLYDQPASQAIHALEQRGAIQGQGGEQ
ncbi:MAG: hypothetical protein ACP5HM_07710 [Anaerolineae bacterium]